MAQSTSSSKQAFSSKYTNANLSPNAPPYVKDIFLGLYAELVTAERGNLKDVALAVMSGMLCAQHRGDCVPRLFSDVVAVGDTEEAIRKYMSVRQAMNLVFPFVGLPNCMPSCLGLIHELQSRGVVPNQKSTRPSFEETSWLAKGTETRQKIYRGVGNPEVSQMIGTWFPELSYVAETAIFGYLISGSLEEQSLPESEIILAGAIIAMGSTRQAKSHIKASIGVGNPIGAVQAVVAVAEKIALWNRKSLPAKIDVAELAQELKQNLEKEAL